MDSERVRAKHRQYLFPNVATYYAEPLVLERGEGMHVYDADGKRYLDFFGGILTVSIGHCHPEVSARVAEQAKTLPHSSTLYATEPLVALAERMAGLAPRHEKGWKLFFTSSGSEANETAVLLARIATGHQEIIALRHSYSGRTALALNLNGHAAWRVQSSTLPGIKHAHAPYCYRCDLKLKYPDCGLACARDIETLIQTETSGKVAALLAEPIMGVGGFIVPPKEYFEVAAAIVRKHGGLLISDEVQTGFGRTGDKRWGIEHYGVTPDIMTFAKGMANGAPIGATMAKSEIADTFTSPSIATFGGNPVSMAAALATLDVIEKQKLAENARDVGAHLRAGLEDLARRFPAIGEVRGMGLMQALELVKDRTSKEPDAAATLGILEGTRRRGLLIGKGGLHGNVLRIAPPLVATRSDVDEALRALSGAFEELA